MNFSIFSGMKEYKIQVSIITGITPKKIQLNIVKKKKQISKLQRSQNFLNNINKLLINHFQMTITYPLLNKQNIIKNKKINDQNNYNKQKPQQLTEMQQKNKQAIFKLLNLDCMITQYQNQLKPYRRQTFLHRYNKNQQHFKPTDVKKIKTIHTINSSTNFQNKRTQSTLTMFKNANKNTISPNKYSKRAISYQSSIPSSMQYHLRVSQRLKCKSTKLLKPDQLIKQDQQLFLKDIVSQNITKIQNQNPPQPHSSKQQKQIVNSNQSLQKNHLHQQKIDHFDKQKILQLTNKLDQAIAKQKQVKKKKIGTILKGRYKLQKIIGRGLSGQVYRGWDILSQRPVAIKIISPQNIQYQFIKQLQHPNLISYYNSFIQNNKRYIILQYLPKSLSQIIRKKKLTQHQLKKIFKSIVQGLMHLHSLSYAHRDIKLDNIMTIQDLSVVKFIDFGLCLDTNQSTEIQNQRFCGTISYMAPQVIQGKCKQPKKADIWSLGVVLYTLSVGKNPFTCKQQAQTRAKIHNTKLLFPPQTPNQLKTLISSMLNKNPAHRPSIFQIINHNWLTQ